MAKDGGEGRSGSEHLEAAKQFVRLGYGNSFGLSFRSLNFRTEPLSTAEAREVIMQIHRYNAFDGG